jgi:hypothetical protein
MLENNKSATPAKMPKSFGAHKEIMPAKVPANLIGGE